MSATEAMSRIGKADTHGARGSTCPPRRPRGPHAGSAGGRAREELERSRSERILVLSPAARLIRLRLRRSLEQHIEERGDERVGRHHRVGVVDGPVLARERNVARVLTDAVLELRANLLRPFLKPP